eukprot:7462749-Alexandrium_andersonii.AAC.1
MSPEAPGCDPWAICAPSPRSPRDDPGQGTGSLLSTVPARRRRNTSRPLPEGPLQRTLFARGRCSALTS